MSTPVIEELSSPGCLPVTVFKPGVRSGTCHSTRCFNLSADDRARERAVAARPSPRSASMLQCGAALMPGILTVAEAARRIAVTALPPSK
jgi:hypothetical protein